MTFPLLIGGAPSRYRINQSLRLRASNSARLSRTGLTAGTANKWAVSFWAKLGAGSNQALFCGYSNGNNYTYFGTSASNQLTFSNVNAGVADVQFTTTAAYRDPTAWYHVAVFVDTTLATASDRYQIWVNGARVTSFATSTNTLAQNSGLYWNDNFTQYIGTFDTVTNYFDGYIAEFINTGRVATNPAVGAFGQFDSTTNSWVPRRYTGTYGANGFYLPFNDAASTTTISQDRSGNGNNWTSSGISVTSGVTFDQMLDSPTNNYAVLHPLRTTGTLSNANLRFQATAAAGNQQPTSSTIYFDVAAATGFYWEVVNASPNSGVGFGLVRDNVVWHTLNSTGVNNTDGSINYNPSNGTLYVNNSLVGTFATMGLTDTLSARVQSGNLWLAVNGTWMNSGNPVATGLTGNWAPSAAAISTSNSIDCQFNFGQRPFAYTPPTGFVALNTANLSTPTIQRGDDAFFAGLRTGTGAAASRSDLRFPPDLTWIKGRSVAYSHGVFDRVRGASQRLVPNLTNAEDTLGGVTAFNANGFSLGTNINFNENLATYVDWAWREGAAYGFDIVTYTGTGAAGNNVAHSLNAIPHFGIVKTRSAAGQAWAVRHRSLTAGHNLRLNTTDASGLASGFGSGGIADFASSSTFTFTQGSTDWLNANGNGATYVAYLWTSIPGFSLFGSYTGNGSADGPFVWCGFRPRFVMIKRVDSTGDWLMNDAARSPSNVVGENVWANLSNAEAVSNRLDLAAGGFKLRNNFAEHNASGGTYIFAAFAENPFKFANAR